MKAQSTIHPLKNAFDGFKSCCSGFLCFEDLTDYLVKLKPKHNSSSSLLIFSLALRSGEGAANKLEEDGVNAQNKDLWSSDKIWMRACQEIHENISCEESLGLIESLPYSKQRLIANEHTFPHFDSYLDSPCMPQVTYLMLRIFTTSK